MPGVPVRSAATCMFGMRSGKSLRTVTLEQGNKPSEAQGDIGLPRQRRSFALAGLGLHLAWGGFQNRFPRSLAGIPTLIAMGRTNTVSYRPREKEKGN